MRVLSPRRAVVLVCALVAVAALGPATAASAGKHKRVTILQFNAAEGTSTCPQPQNTNCLAVLDGANGNRDMYAVEEVCYPDYVRYKAAHPGWTVVFGRQSTQVHAPKSAECRTKGNVLASPYAITNTRIYQLSRGFRHAGIQHHYVMVCGEIHAKINFYGCATHLVFPRYQLQRVQVGNLVKDTAGYRRFGRVVVAGDFNIAESSHGAGSTPRLRPLTRSRFVETDPSNTPTHRTRKFDYIFYFGKRGVRNRAALTGPVSTSDHAVLIGEAKI